MKKILTMVLCSTLLVASLFTACASGDGGTTDNGDNDNVPSIENPDLETAYANASQVSIIDASTNEEIENNKITVCEFYSKQIKLVADDGYELPQDLQFRSSNPTMLAVDDTGSLFYISKGQCQLIISNDDNFTKVVNIEKVPFVTITCAVPLQIEDTDGVGGTVKSTITEITYDQNGIYLSGNVTLMTGPYLEGESWWIDIGYNMSNGAGGTMQIGVYREGEMFYRVKVYDLSGRDEPITVSFYSLV